MDGVTLKVEVIDGGGAPVTVLSATQDQSTWSFRRVNLDRYAGRKIIVRFQVLPNGNTQCDWALLGDPRVIDGRGAGASTPVAASAPPQVVAELAQTAPLRTGIMSRLLTPWQGGIQYRDAQQPLDSEGTGAVVSANGEKTADGIAKPGYFFQPPSKELQGAAVFADFVVSVPRSPGQALPAREATKPAPRR